ncbi:MAG: serine/threonine protein kinase [Deltaproteobacteria bacterium]|nr:MAG: serine/threonine protein kinase [Deltaproteobacteria bacterium]
MRVVAAELPQGPGTALSDALAAAAPPGQIEKYRVLEPIGEGGMSVVYRARDEALQRNVAIKVMHRHLAKDPEARTRFSREARAVARLTHRNIPKIYDFSSSDSERNYIVAELVEGAPLATLLREGPAPLPELGVMMCIGVASALRHAHENRIIHRDVKPENILVGRDGVAKLTDFGIAQIVGLESMTMTGTLIGSPAHMAPEQIDGTKHIDYRVDIWALGTVLYMAVTGGTLPFDADNPHSVLKRIVEGNYQDPRRINPHVDSELARIIGRCLQVDRDARYPTMEELEGELHAWLEARGLNDPEAEIRAMMADPVGYHRILSDHLSATLMAMAEEAVAERERHRALELYGRVLVLDPDHPAAFERVRRLTSGMRTRRRVVWGATGVVVVVVAAVGVWMLTRPGPVPRTTASALPAVDAPAVTQTAPSLVAAAPAEEAHDPKDHAPLPPVTAGAVAGAALAGAMEASDRLFAEAEKRRLAKKNGTPRRVTPVNPVTPVGIAPVDVRLTSYPSSVQLAVDGRTVPAGATVSLKPGTYPVTLTIPTCPECEPAATSLVVTPDKASYHLPFPTEASVTFTCPGTHYVQDDKGQRYKCNVKNTVKLDSPRPKTLFVSLYAEDGTVMATHQPVVLIPGKGTRKNF